MGGVVDRLDSCITLQRPQQAEGMNREDAHDIQYAKPCTWGEITLGTGTYMLGTNQSWKAAWQRMQGPGRQQVGHKPATCSCCNDTELSLHPSWPALGIALPEGPEWLDTTTPRKASLSHAVALSRRQRKRLVSTISFNPQVINFPHATHCDHI